MQVYTTTQLAELLDSKPSTLRSYKQRHRDRFQEGESFVRDEQGSLLWTLQGATLLAEIVDTPAAQRWLQAQPPPAPAVTAPPPDPSLTALDTMAEAVAWQLIQQQFHHRLGTSLQQILHHPNPAQREYLDRVLLNLGLSMGWANLVQTLQSPIQQTWTSVTAEQRAIAMLNYGTETPSPPPFVDTTGHFTEDIPAPQSESMTTIAEDPLIPGVSPTADSD